MLKIILLCKDNNIISSPTHKVHPYFPPRKCVTFAMVSSSMPIAFEFMSTGMTSSANYEIVSIYGQKYIIFSSGGDIEVLNY
jgi:hypothetical protein